MKVVYVASLPFNLFYCPVDAFTGKCFNHCHPPLFTEAVGSSGLVFLPELMEAFVTEVPGPVNRGPGSRDSLGHNIVSFQETAVAAVRLCVLSHSLFLWAEPYPVRR